MTALVDVQFIWNELREKTEPKGHHGLQKNVRLRNVLVSLVFARFTEIRAFELRSWRCKYICSFEGPGNWHSVALRDPHRNHSSHHPKKTYSYFIRCTYIYNYICMCVCVYFHPLISHDTPSFTPFGRAVLHSATRHTASCKVSFRLRSKQLKAWAAGPGGLVYPLVN